MKITFLGTSHGVPSYDRYCSCALIESGDAFYFIDAGAPVTDIIHRRGLDMRRFRAMFTTHAHADHTSGIPYLAGLINWYYKDCGADFYMTEQEMADAIENLIFASDTRFAVDKERVRLKVAREGLVYADENIKVEYFPTYHMEIGKPSYAILVTEGNKKVLFTGDMSHNVRKNDIPAIAFEGRVNSMICEMAHFNVDDLKPYLEKLKINDLYFNHVYPLKNYDDIEAIKNNYSFKIHTPRDNDSFEI